MTITISDPWDLVKEIGNGPLKVYPIAPMSQDANRLLCALKQPLRYKSVEFSFVVIQARHVGVTLADEGSSSIPCNIASLTNREGDSKSMDESIPWQERIGMIGSFQPLRLK